jgi:Pectate lyase superfamily protein
MRWHKMVSGTPGAVMNNEPDDVNRRTLLATLAIGGGSVATMTGISGAYAATSPGSQIERLDGWYNLKRDFNAVGNGAADDTEALQTAINSGAGNVRPIVIPPGVYKTTRALTTPPNTMLFGSAPGLGFGCRIEPTGCPAFVIGGASPSFHCSFENLMIWPKGPAPDFLVSIDNSYSVTFRNLRIHDAQQRLGRAAVLLLGAPKSGGHGRCNNVIWDNLVVRNDNGQPAVAVLATSGSGSHRFLMPDLENFAVLLDWKGGQLDLVAPYMERAGRFAVNCNPHPEDQGACLNTFGGLIDTAISGLGCAIGATTRNFNSFGTAWGLAGGRAAYVYGLPAGPVTFHGLVPTGKAGVSQFGGIEGWRRFVDFSQPVIRASRASELIVPPDARAQMDIDVAGAEVGAYWARVTVNADTAGALLSAFVSKPGVVTIVAVNLTSNSVKLSGVFTVECGIA